MHASFRPNFTSGIKSDYGFLFPDIDFLFVFVSNHGTISYRFGDITAQMLKFAKNGHPSGLMGSLGVITLEFWGDLYLAEN